MVHAGGFIPYQGGRWVHGWEVRPEPKVHLKHSPQRYLDRLRYDTITHAKAPLANFWSARPAPTACFLGSDYPYDMGTGECVRQVQGRRTFPRPTATRSSAAHAAEIFSKKRAHAAA